MKKVEILKKNVSLLKAKKITISATCFYVRTTQYSNNVFSSLRF